MKNKRVIFTAEVGPPIRNGVVMSMALFARGLRQLGWEVLLAIPSYQTSHPDRYSILYPQLSLPMNLTKGYGLGLLFLVKDRLVKFRPDLIHTHHMFSSGEYGWWLARQLKIPVVHSYHTYLAQYAHYAILPGARQLLGWYSQNYANRVDHLVVPSSPTYHLLKSYQVTKPISIVPTGVDLDEFPLNRRHHLRQNLGQRYRLDRSIKILIYVGRLVPEKNIDLLLESMALITRKDQRVRLMLVGPGMVEHYQDLARRLAINQYVIFTGGVEPPVVKKYLVASDIFVFGSTTDTQGLVILEAMAAGCVPVAVRVGGPIDLIRDRYDGRLTSPFPRDFADRILSLLHNLTTYHRLRRNAMAKASQTSYLHQAEKLAQVYDQEIALTDRIQS